MKRNEKTICGEGEIRTHQKNAKTRRTKILSNFKAPEKKIKIRKNNDFCVTVTQIQHRAQFFVLLMIMFEFGQQRKKKRKLNFKSTAQIGRLA